MTDGIVAGLVQAKIIYRSTTMSTHVPWFSYNITDFAWEYLNENPDLLAD